jgi:hypothetical protein
LPNRHVFAWWLFRQAIVHFSVAFSIDQSDQSSCAKQRRKGYPHMTTAETTATDKAAAVAEQGAHVAPEKAPTKKTASQKGHAEGQENRHGCQSQSRRSQEDSHGSREGQQQGCQTHRR